MPVNVTHSRYKKILSQLENTEQPVSGEVLAEAAGVSRVAVWKILNKMRDLGYVIESDRSGYRLIAVSEKPLPWELGDQSGTVEYFFELDSTMAKAAELIESGAEDGTTVIADHQSSGKTADGGKWISPEGGLYFTRIRRKPFPAAFSGLYTSVICTAVAEVLTREYNIKTDYNWPNRLSCSSGTLGGVLTEARISGGIAAASAAGIGINVNTPGSEMPESAASLQLITGKPLSGRELYLKLVETIDRYEGIFFGCRFADREDAALLSMIDRCEKSMPVINKTVKVSGQSRGKSRGVITGLDFCGALKLVTDNGKIEFIYPGDNISYE